MAGIDVSLLVINWCINLIVLRVEWWFDGKLFSSVNRMKSNCTSYSSCLQRVRRQRDWFHTAAGRDVVWHSLATDRDKLFCVQSVSECQFHMRSHDSVSAFFYCLLDWAQGLRHSQCSRWHTQNVVCVCQREHTLPCCRSIVSALRIIFNRVKILPHFEHLLCACLTDTWTERTYV